MKYLILSFLGACLNLLPAQEASTQKVTFFAFDLPEFPAGITVQTSASAFNEIELMGANATSAGHVVNREGFILIHGPEKTGADGKPVHPVLGKVKTNPDWPHAFVVLVGSAGEKGLKFQGESFPISDKDFPKGSIKFANLSPFPVRGKLGETVVGIKAGEFQTIQFKEPAGELVDVVFQYQDDSDKWRRMIATRWAIPGEERSIMFAFQDPRTKSILSKTLPVPE